MNNRIIKFRAWDKNIKEYRDVVFDTADYRFGFIIEHDGTLDSDCFIWEQYTGLKDKNSVEIFESDKAKWKGRIYIIEYSEGCYWLDSKNGDLDVHILGIDMKSQDIEIIGNIHESVE